MKSFAILIFLTLAASVVHSQIVRRVIIWGGEKDCGFKSRAVDSADMVTCGSVESDRGPVSTISSNRLSLAAAFLEEGDYEIVAVKIMNRSAEPVMFDSDTWGAAHFKSVEEYLRGGKPLVAESSIPSRDLIRKTSRRTSMADSIEEFVADGTMTTEVREIRRADGTRVRRDVIVPDQEARAAAERRGVIRADAAANEMRRLRSTALTAKTVPAAGFVKGLVYFRRIKKAGYRVFSLTVDGTYYIFRLPRIKTPVRRQG